MKVAITLLVLLVVSSGYFINDSFAEISENQPFLLEGSGFAVTEESIKISEIDLSLFSQQQHGSTIDFLTVDGFITLDDEEFLISSLEGKFLREGRFIRISGDIESTNGLDTSVSFFGRLVEESKDASVYGFTGRITTPDDTFKIIYTTKLSTLSEITTSSEESNALTIHILENAYLHETGRYFDNSLLSTIGTSFTIVNDDAVSHKFNSVISHISTAAHINYSNILICELGEVIVLEGNKISADATLCDYNKDERISTSVILPGESLTINVNDIGNYRIIDPDYPWMQFNVFFFNPNSDTLSFNTR